LSATNDDGFRTAFFHPLASCGEFTVSTQVLRNEKLASRRTHGNDFKFFAYRGPNSQSGNHIFDFKTNVMFFAEMQRNAISCWNTRTYLTEANIHTVLQNNQTMIYPADLSVKFNSFQSQIVKTEELTCISFQIDNESTLWVLSNRLPRFIYDRYNTSEFNFNIFKADVNEVLADTSCLP
jgi:dopachrome tautomerase